MRSTVLDSEAKEALRKTVRRLRALLLDRLDEAARGEYRLDAGIEKAKLPDARHRRRQQLDAWLDEYEREAKPAKGKVPADLRLRGRAVVVKEAAYTWLNRLVFLRMLEHHGVQPLAVISGGEKSPGSIEFARYAGPLAADDSRGSLSLLKIIFAELALELPGLFGPVGLTELVPMPAGVLAELITALNDRTLDSAWGDDTTLGWVYQYWNDPEREALDAKIAGGGKIEPHEIASKTQMFTERYMVEWLLQNSVGLTWLSMCKRHGWRPHAEPVLAALETRRADWRRRREAGEVAADALMPIEAGLESAWKYYVPQPIPDDAVEKAPTSIRELKLLDPASGSGHFLVIAFDLLARLYQEEAAHRGESWSDTDIAQSIVANNLYGIDIDARAIQIAAAGLWLKARLFAPEARLSQLNLVAPALTLATLPSDDPALVELRAELKREVNLPEDLTQKLVASLAGVSYLGSLLRVDAAIEEALRQQELVIEQGKPGQGDLFRGFPLRQMKLSLGEAKATVLDRLERFLAQHSSSEDLGLRLDGEQLAAGVRFVRMAKEGSYDIVVGNPPYQALSKTAQFEYVTKNYARGKADLYAAFLERGIELCRPAGLTAMVTMQGWMFLGQYTELRRWMLEDNSPRAIADLMWCAFENMRHATVSMAVIAAGVLATRDAVTIMPTVRAEREESQAAFARKKAALLAQVGRYEFDPKGFEVIEGEPIVYWWSKEFLERYASLAKLGRICPARFGLTTGDNERFVRFWHEVPRQRLLPWSSPFPAMRAQPWAPFVLGGKGRLWFEPLREVCRWLGNGLEVKEKCVSQYGTVSKQIRNEHAYFQPGVAFAMIGANFSGRAHRYPSVIGNMGSSVYPSGQRDEVLALMNSRIAASVLSSLNPGLHFEVGDVNRLPMFPVSDSPRIVHAAEAAFALHESHRELSVEFKSPGASPWRSAQAWAQLAVDRPEAAPLPPYEPELDPPEPEAHVSFAIGVALGRFGANREGILDQAPAEALPGGILFVVDAEDLPDSLKHPAAQRILDAWTEHAPAILKGKRQSLRDWLRKDFFAYHKGLYENRPIYFPLSSEKRSFVAHVNIHRWQDDTLKLLLADHLHPLLRQLDGEIVDVNRARASSDKKAASAAEKQYATVKKLRDELADFIEAVAACAERGAPPTDPKCPPRDADTPFHMDLDDGVMVNSAALWPLLSPQWKDPAKWWKHLCLAEGKKDYDWAHLSRRYFPDRVEAKCKSDPSLGVAHGRFWKYHPAKAYAWELRLKDEIRSDFTIDEADSDAARDRFLADHPQEAAALREKEELRRKRKAAKEDADAEDDVPSAGDGTGDGTPDDADD
jgi:hypothetical protein